MRKNESDSPKRKTAPAAKRTRAVSTPAKSRKKAQSAPKVPPAVRPDADLIRERAYELYLQRGHHGDPMEDWLRAERELIEQTAG
jgi:Protein of unknown function (DUF2934)